MAEMTLAEAKAWLRTQVEAGVRCPCCNQMAKVYKRPITSSSARSLIAIYRAGGAEDFVHLPTVLGRKQADEAKMTYWGLIIEAGEARPDGGRAGWWMLTALGVDFIKERVSVPKYARIYDARCLGLTGPQVTIRDALGTKFDLADLMSR